VWQSLALTCADRHTALLSGLWTIGKIAIESFSRSGMSQLDGLCQRVTFGDMHSLRTTANKSAVCRQRHDGGRRRPRGQLATRPPSQRGRARQRVDIKRVERRRNAVVISWADVIHRRRTVWWPMTYMLLLLPAAFSWSLHHVRKTVIYRPLKLCPNDQNKPSQYFFTFSDVPVLRSLLWTAGLSGFLRWTVMASMTVTFMWRIRII